VFAEPEGECHEVFAATMIHAAESSVYRASRWGEEDETSEQKNTREQILPCSRAG
jgi:hypothetical protein